jgi:MOSC domain-containing protein YiiM
MKVLSVNIGKSKKIKWQFKTVETGIFKYAVDIPIFLDTEDVKNDHVIDRKHHGGNDKAVYMYAKNNYKFFQELYPDLEFHNGIFGENITIDNLSETEVYIGDIFQIGEAIIQVSQPRFPCFKLGIVFNNQKIVKQFLNAPFSGFYFRVLQKGIVKKDDEMNLIEKAKNSMTVAEIYSIYTTNKGNNLFIKKALNLEFLAEQCKASIKKRMI